MSNTPLPPELPMDLARRLTAHQIALLLRVEAASDGRVHGVQERCRHPRCDGQGVDRGGAAYRGRRGLDEDLYFLDVLYAAGLRSIGPVWSRTNIFGHGVPFRFPHSPDIGPGLTEAGKRLVAACNAKRIMIDLSHITERGFWDVAELSTRTAGGHPLQCARADGIAAQSDGGAAAGPSATATAWSD